MASYQDIRILFSDSDLFEKIEVATIIAANGLLGGTPTTQEKAWAATVFSSPSTEAKKALMAVLATYSNLTVVQIQAATDPAIQTGVDAVVGVLVDAMAGV